MDKKVLLIATVQSHIAQFHQPLIELLKEAGYKVDIAAKNNLKEKDNLKITNADKIYDIPFSREPFSKTNIIAYRQVKTIIKANAYDIVHCNTPMGGVIGRLASYRSSKNIEIIYTAHGYHFFKGASIKNWLFYYPIEKILSLITDKIVTINDEDYVLSKAKFKHAKVYRIHSTGVDSEKFSITNKNNKIKKIICIGELNRNKNQIQLLKAAKILKKENIEFKIIIAGNGKQENELKNFINENNLNNCISLLGYVSNIDKYIKDCDIGVSMSKREGLGLNVIEECLCGIPVVCTKNRGHNELISETNGFLVNIDDEVATAAVLKNIITDKVEFKASAVRDSVMKFSVSHVKKELKNIYEI